MTQYAQRKHFTRPKKILLVAGLLSSLLSVYLVQPKADASQAKLCQPDLLVPAQTNHEQPAHLALMTWEYTLFPDKVPKAQTPEVKPLNAGEVASLKTHMTRRLPQYHELFKNVASNHDLDWHLVAAICYQESHWHPKAKSPTGVRGMMMLTLPTAKEVGVKNRLNAEQSVRGGVRYLKQLKRRLPEALQEPDRTWQALAAYNIGMGHLYDARTLASKAGKNPNSWADVSHFLRKLEDPLWHKQTNYGYARGSEPVTYVTNIQRYYRYLQNHHVSRIPAMAKNSCQKSKVL